MVCDNLEEEMCQGGKILEFHTSGFFPERWFQCVVLLRVDNTPLYDRLKERGYGEEKIRENIECEILQVTHEEVFDSYKAEAILELQNDKLEQMEENLEKIIGRVDELRG